MGLSSDVPETQLLMKSVSVKKNPSPAAIVTTRNPEGHTTNKILDALKTVFKPFQGQRQIKVCTMLLYRTKMVDMFLLMLCLLL